MKRKVFEEEQVFEGTDLLVVSSICLLLITLGFWQNLSANDWGYWSIQTIAIFALVIIVAGLWFRSLIRRTQRNVITNKSLICQISSWQKHKRKLNLNNIQRVSIIKTSLSAQWGGGNLNYSDEEFWSINGRNGLAISTKDGQQIFVGSKKPDQMAKALKKAIKRRTT